MVRAEAGRSKLSDGVPVAVADFGDPVSLAAALEGAERAYPVTPNLFFQGLLAFAPAIAAGGSIHHLYRRAAATLRQQPSSPATTPRSSPADADRSTGRAAGLHLRGGQRDELAYPPASRHPPAS